MATPRTKRPQQPKQQALTHRQTKPAKQAKHAKHAKHAQALAEQTGADFIIGWCARVELNARRRAAAQMNTPAALAALAAAHGA